MIGQSLLQLLSIGPSSRVELAAGLDSSLDEVDAALVCLRNEGLPIEQEGGSDRLSLAMECRLLDAERLLAALGAAARGQLHSLELKFETGSTQDDALLAPAPEHGCAIFFAERQTAGQGSRGRAWTSPLAANLYFSIVRRFDLGLPALSGLSLIVGVAIAEALRALAYPVSVKWPNDLVAEGRKLGGILVQLRSDSPKSSHVVIGVGLNVRMPATIGSQIGQPWCDLAQLGSQRISRSALAAAILDRLLPALEQFATEGLPAFQSRWRELDALSGQPVRVSEGLAEHEGVALGITETGALRVAIGGETKIFHSGEASLRPA